ncbi:hypothetical protein R3W88_018626 [Solanum pinnatisectum]|uniref:Glutathione peroxidase n=1 Tax=Solanum pinnatisectum TaxID=50273 RepID=A0AAV9L4C0_9SOLN|nr:hypothetical protein R3W88_018626 [Solanum pinnatisectum]
MESSPPSSILNSQDSKGKDVDLTIYNEKVLLLPNGFEVLAFPCNQFLKQEPGTSEEAQQFACTRFKAEYPIFQKVRVNGPDAAPVYQFLKSSNSGFLGSSIKWNVTKFLIDKEGKVIKRYGSTTAPLAIELIANEAMLQKLLAVNSL